DNATDFSGTWGVFSDFGSGIVIVSDRQRGLFVFDNPQRPERVTPTVSTWGLAAMTLLLLVAATLAIRRVAPTPRRAADAARM
ncbi:MAG: hypothetical protein ACE5EX_01400, partial [Phycisphaerae bacterium]